MTYHQRANQNSHHQCCQPRDSEWSVALCTMLSLPRKTDKLCPKKRSTYCDLPNGLLTPFLRLDGCWRAFQLPNGIGSNRPQRPVLTDCCSRLASRYRSILRDRSPWIDRIYSPLHPNPPHTRVSNTLLPQCSAERRASIAGCHQFR